MCPPDADAAGPAGASGDTLEDLRRRLAEFADDRDWDQFHSPKNLAMALIAEAAELVEHFQWLTQAQSQALAADRREQVRLELADILIYLVRIADRLDMDLVQAARDKIAINESRFPVERVRGIAGRGEDFED
ncbi:MAG TPA: nucleotide pyrophosphohydrolase [Gammaproteobacteria bacterium]|nr:nucleotide pyrophosphohydrolase [Gammaproteobacteria bacterium]